MSDTTTPPPLPTGGRAFRPASLAGWFLQGLQVLLLRRPRWDALVNTPAILVSLLVLWYGVVLLSSRLAIDGAADFNVQALREWGWLSVAGFVLAAWVAAGDRPRVPAASIVAMGLTLGLLFGVAGLPLLALGIGAEAGEARSRPSVPMVALGVTVLLWYHLAQALLVWRSASVGGPRRAMALALALGSALVVELDTPHRFWTPASLPGDVSPEPSFRLTQQVFEAQAQALERDLGELPRQRAGVVDVYAIGYAPDATEAVFGLETAMVADVMQQRYGTQTLQLVSRYEDAPRHAWATPPNLRRAIARVAQRMDRDEDILFIHLSTHGVRSGGLMASFWPLEVEPLLPQDLRLWLDEAGVRHRVVSVSACFSGSWIAPLAGDDALVMTASDAAHTSYGCGRGSELTYYGRAVFHEAMRAGASFEAALVAARPLIEQREQAAGKKHGFSNPQIAVGGRIRERLAQLEAQPARRAAGR